MRTEVKKKWIDALRSGKYAQAKKALRSPDGTEYCCLGVLCEVYREETGKGEWSLEGDLERVYFHDGSSSRCGVPPSFVLDWAGITQENPQVDLSEFKKCSDQDASLAEANDAGLNFSQIADIIEAQL